jgi:hypothetical protein
VRISLAYLFLVSALSFPACASSLREKIPDEQTLASLEQRAALAPAKDECYLYAELAHEMVEYGARQYASGGVEKATKMLKQTQQVTRKIRMILGGNAHKLKEAQILLRRTAFRLTELLHASSYEDRPLVQETLAELNAAENDTMMQLFKK